MLNENKIKIRTKIALFEKESKSTKLKIEKLTTAKYIANGIFWTFISISVAFAFFLILISLCKGNFSDDIRYFLNNPIALLANKKVIISYVVVEIVFILIALAFYSYKYFKLQPKISEYKRRWNILKGFAVKKENNK